MCYIICSTALLWWPWRRCRYFPVLGSMALTGKSYCICFIARPIGGNCNTVAGTSAKGVAYFCGLAGQRLCPVRTWPSGLLLCWRQRVESRAVCMEGRAQRAGKTQVDGSWVNRLAGYTQAGKQRKRANLELRLRLALLAGIRCRSAFLGCVPWEYQSSLRCILKF